MPRPKGKKIPGQYWFSTRTKNRLEWLLKDSKYSGCFVNETSVIEQSIELMYRVMTDQKYDHLLNSFFECPAE
jgi:hypothetical protein